jgi:glycerophosphoryl diester phosphodiesterase
MSELPVPRLVAHRGYLLNYPENTWPALEAALQAGACWLEFDIQLCADGRFLLLHDADFRRTANRPESVFTVSLSEIQHISVHEPLRLGPRFAPLRAPLLDEVLQRLAAFPACRCMVEIKRQSLDHWGLETVMSRLLETLRPYQASCVLISYSQAALRYAKRHGGMEIGWVLHSYDEAQRREAQALQPDFIICNEARISAGQPLWSGRWQWMLYDIVDPGVALAWAHRGATLIETADIGAMLQHPALAEKACQHGL